MPINDRVRLRTRRLRQFSAKDLPSNCVCIFAASGIEERSALPAWAEYNTSMPQSCIRIIEQKRDSITIIKNTQEIIVSLRNEETLKSLVTGTQTLVIDVTGLTHQVWAALLRVAWTTVERVYATYTEPIKYRFHTSPASSSIFDLSTGFEGAAPLPGFARLQIDASRPRVFVPLLGFEGMRARNLFSEFDDIFRTIPIIGVPGFQLEYPTHTVSCNREFLEETSAHRDIRYAKASCPFETRQVLREIRKDYPGAHLVVAPVGTKPQALGAILFIMEESQHVELVYDYPLRKPERTKGIGLTHIYALREN